MTLAHDVTGAGPTVVLLHSTVCDRRMWTPLTPFLVAAGYRVITCDLVGFGDSAVPARPFNDADEVAELVSAVGAPSAGSSLATGASAAPSAGSFPASGASGASPGAFGDAFAGPPALTGASFAVIGASGGGGVALELAARFPSRVSALGLLCTALPGFPRGPELRAFGAREDELLEAGDLDAATTLNVDLWLGPSATPATRAEVHTMQRHNFEVQPASAEEIEHPWELTDITAPTLLVSGAHDLPDFTAIATHLASTLPRATHHHLDWAGHLPSLERPDLLAPILTNFLAAARMG